MWSKGRGKSKPRRIYEAVPEEDFLKMLKITRKKVHQVCFILAYGSGLRVSEVTKLEKQDIDLKRHTIFIRQAKGGRDRVTNTPKWLREVHMAHFPVKIGERAIGKAFLTASLKAGINSVIYVDKKGHNRYRYHFHSLRHSYATRALEKGVPVHQVQLLLGHADLATTSQYTKANPKDAIDSILEAGV